MTRTLLMLAMGAALAACATTAPDWEARFGDATRQARSAQLIDPNAAQRPAAPMLIDGKAAAGAQTRYSASYGYAVKDAPAPALNVAPAK